MDKVAYMKQVTSEMVTMYETKNSDYGDSFAKTWSAYGAMSFFIRAADKLNRLEALLLNNKVQQVKDESIKDTLKDLATYSIMSVNFQIKIRVNKK